MIETVVVTVLLVCFGLVILRGAPYVPSHRQQLRRAFTELYKLSVSDTVVDLGSGDGVVVREARRCGARAIGYELNPILCLVGRVLSWGDRHAEFMVRDYTQLPSLPEGTTVVYAFTTSHSIEGIGHLCERWSRAKELYFISYGFTLADKKPLRHVGAMYLYHFSPDA